MSCVEEKIYECPVSDSLLSQLKESEHLQVLIDLLKSKQALCEALGHPEPGFTVTSDEWALWLCREEQGRSLCRSIAAQTLQPEIPYSPSELLSGVFLFELTLLSLLPAADRSRRIVQLGAVGPRARDLGRTRRVKWFGMLEEKLPPLRFLEADVREFNEGLVDDLDVRRAISERKSFYMYCFEFSFNFVFHPTNNPD